MKHLVLALVVVSVGVAAACGGAPATPATPAAPTAPSASAPATPDTTAPVTKSGGW